MAKSAVLYTDHFDAVMKVLTTRGLLVGAYGPDGKPNLMTIGWGALGSIWGKPLWVVLVRPSRHTYGCIEKHGAFTVNVPAALMADVCSLCGSKSGRDLDKFAACGLTAERAGTVDAPAAAECPIVYECRVVASADIAPERLDPAIVSGAYPRGDFHRVYWGEILAVRAVPNAAALL